MGAFATRIYKSLDPFTYAESDNSWALACFLGALGTMFQEVEDYASDKADGSSGWAILIDVDNGPDKGLSWLGQFVGVSVDASLSTANQRQQVKSANAQKRGTLAALKAAPIPWLAGTQKVSVRERDASVVPSDPAYAISVYTLTSETTSHAAVLAALLAVKPAGIVMNYQDLAGQLWSTLNTNYASWNLVSAHYTSWDGVKADQTGI